MHSRLAFNISHSWHSTLALDISIQHWHSALLELMAVAWTQLLVRRNSCQLNSSRYHSARLGYEKGITAFWSPPQCHPRASKCLELFQTTFGWDRRDAAERSDVWCWDRTDVCCWNRKVSVAETYTQLRCSILVLELEMGCACLFSN